MYVQEIFFFLTGQGIGMASCGTSLVVMPGTQPLNKSVSYDTLKIQGEEEGFWKLLQQSVITAWRSRDGSSEFSGHFFAC